MDMFRACLTAAVRPTLPAAASAAPTLAQRLGSAWDDICYGVSWFFTHMEPAGIWAIPALAAVIGFFAYYCWCIKPKRGSLEWVAMAETKKRPLTLTLRRHPMEKKDILPVLLLTVVYAATAFFRLGDFTAPQSYAVFQADTAVTFSFGQVVEVDEISYFTVLGTGHYTLEYSADGVNWGSIDLDQAYNTLLKWRLDNLNETEDGTTPMGPISAKMFRLTAGKIDRPEGLWLGELALWSQGQALMPIYVDDAGAALFDEPSQWTTESTYMNSSYFDEIYHARTALEHLNNIYPYEVSHPPLGKLILSLGILMFGMTPFGWRFMGTLCGVLMVPVLYIFLKNLFGRTSVALCGACLFTFDFMHLVQTRIATIDSYGVFFILVSYYFMYRYLTVPAGQPLRKSVPSLLLCGLFWGIGCASKWIVIYAGVGLAVLWLLGLIFKGREWKRLRTQSPTAPLPRFGAHAAGITALSVVFFVLIPAAVYLASYLPYVTAWAAQAEGREVSLKSLWDLMWNNQVFMLTYHQGVHTPHPYESYWYQWIFDGRPILYYRDLSYAQAQGIKSLFASFNNPLVSWAGLLAFFAMIGEVIRRKSGKALFILVAILSQFVPWLPIGRILFAYHYFPTVLFLTFAVAYEMNRILARRRGGCKAVVYGFTAYTTALYFIFYPALTGLYTPLWYNSLFLCWFPSWPL